MIPSQEVDEWAYDLDCLSNNREDNKKSLFKTIKKIRKIKKCRDEHYKLYLYYKYCSKNIVSRNKAFKMVNYFMKKENHILFKYKNDYNHLYCEKRINYLLSNYTIKNKKDVKKC